MFASPLTRDNNNVTEERVYTGSEPATPTTLTITEKTMTRRRKRITCDFNKRRYSERKDESETLLTFTVRTPVTKIPRLIPLSIVRKINY